jgi:hypothetical protein
MDHSEVQAAFAAAHDETVRASDNFDRVWHAAEDRTTDEFKANIAAAKTRMKEAEAACMRLGLRLEELMGDQC